MTVQPMPQPRDVPVSTWRLLRGMIAARPWLYLVNVVCWTIIYQFPLIPGLIARAFFDSLTAGEQARFTPSTLIVLLLASTLAQITMIAVGGWFDTLHRFMMSSLLRRNMLRGVLKLPGAQALPKGTGEAISRFRDDPTQIEDTLSWILDTIGMAVAAVWAFSMLFRINTRLTVLVFLPLVGIVVVTRMAGNWIAHYRLASRKATAAVTGALGDMFGAVHAIQLAGAEAAMIDHLEKLNEHRRHSMIRDRLLTQGMDSIVQNTVSLGTGLILLIGAQALRVGTFTVGDFALVVYYLAFITEWTQMFGRFLAQYRQAEVSFRRMATLIDDPAADTLIDAGPLHLRGAIPSVPLAVRSSNDRLALLEVRNLGYHHAGGNGIAGIDLRLKRGTVIVITGEIGSGKTTLLHALLGLLPRQEGEIVWNGMAVADPADFLVPPRAAFTPQIPMLFSDRLRSNVLLGVPTSEEALMAALHLAVLEQDVAHMDAGLETLVGPHGVKLSGGQIQRVAAARMLVRQPELLVVDDLSSALDVHTERLLWDRLFDHDLPACLVVSHRRAVLRRADQIVVLSEGRIDAQGSVEELLNTSPSFQRIWFGTADTASASGGVGLHTTSGRGDEAAVVGNGNGDSIATTAVKG
ncbi:MAG: ABC transporter ATP-binding protein [Herpetosiphon sp.]